MEPLGRRILIYIGIIFYLYATSLPCSGSKVIRTSAKSLAERAGAAQYAVHIEEELTPEEIGGRHDLRKRLSDDNVFDDSDYEIYQGVVGRPGVDFPVLTGIPQTTFNCRKFGNGYFADLETECQVFHICEGGKKISFLCPNGTIFQQTDLICDWWFKVNCAASPGHYAESSEVLSRAQHRPNTTPLYETNDRPKQATKTVASDRKDNNRGISRVNPNNKYELSGISNENYDFEDISLPNQPKANTLNIDRRGRAQNRDISKSVSSHEAQEFAASSSFVGSQQNSFVGYHYKEPSDKKFTLASERKPESTTKISGETATATTQVPIITKAPANSIVKDSNFEGYYYQEPDRSSRRLETTKASPLKYTQEPTTTLVPVTYPRRGTTTYKNSLKQTQNQFIINVVDTTVRDDRIATSTPAESKKPIVSTTTRPITSSTSKAPPLIRDKPSKFTTIARFETSRTTPFYTPTVPTILSSRPTISSRIASQRQSIPTESTIQVAEHAIEMMKTLEELKLDVPAGSGKESGGRPGLIIPPSSGPETLHSLALYFATAADSLVAKPSDTTTIKTDIPGLEGFDVQVGNVTKLESTLVSDSTKRRYESLFGTDDIQNIANAMKTKSQLKVSTETSNINVENKVSAPENNDLETEFSNNPIISAAAGTSQIRELAQVFTHALSAYLHDPTTFRRVLSEIRPTEPPTTRAFEFLTNRIGRTEDFNKGTGPTYLPTVPTLSATGTTPITPTTDELEVLDFSDVTASTENAKETGTTNFDLSESSTTQSLDSTATASPSTSAEIFSTTHSNILKESLKHIDHVPASRILTEALENYAINHYTSNSLSDGTTETSNPLAVEINGGLDATTIFPYLDEFENNEHNDNNDTNYFPSKDGSNKNIESPKPYGLGVKPSNSTPIHSQAITAESLRSSWNSATTEDSTYSTTEAPAALSFELLPPSTVNKGFALPTHDILPPDDNDLQRAQSQSIFGNGKNNLEQRTGKEYGEKSKQTFEYDSIKSKNGHYITQITPTATPSPDLQKTTIPDTGKISPNPWSTLTYTIFLDPLTINDGLMSSNEQSTITPSPHTYLPQSTQTPTYADVNRITTEPTLSKFASRLSLKELASGSSDENRRGKAKLINSASIQDDYMEVMQKKANEMFGQLNDTSAGHLMNVMKQADKSKTVRRLILLLIQTCDDDYNKTVEQSRTALLNALIGMDGKIDDENELQIIRARPIRYGKNLIFNNSPNFLSGVTTSTQLPITTYHRPLNLRADIVASTTSAQYLFESTSTVASIDTETTTNYPYRSTGYTEQTSQSDYSTTAFGTDAETTTTYQPTTTTTTAAATTTTSTTTTSPRTVGRRKSSQPTQPRNSKRISKDLDQYLANHGDTPYEVNAAHKNSDARALELLRSLYSLAGRFGK